VNEVSQLGVMIYLNANEFNSGATNFLREEDCSIITAVNPETGKFLIFEHHIYHEGAKVLDGKKYFMRNEVMYQRDGIVQTAPTGQSLAR